MASTSHTISLHFLQKKEIYEREKPYAFRFDVDDIAPTNMKWDQRLSIPISDIRGADVPFSLLDNGFAILNLESKLKPQDFYDPSKIPIYFQEVELLLKAHLKADKVKIFRHGLRKRHPEFPVSTGEQYEYDQPTSIVHIDTTPEEALNEVQRQKNGSESNCTYRRTQWINIWKPLKGPLNDWPLAVCDASTVNASLDLEPADLLYPDFVTENYQVYYNPKMKWYYLSNHKPTELMVFMQADSLADSIPGVPHCSFLNPSTPEGEPPRESVEARALVYYVD